VGTRTLTVRLTANIASLRAGLAAGAAQVKGFGQDVAASGLSTKQSTDKLAKGFLVAGGIIGGALAYGVAKATEFEATMRNITTISDFVGRNFEQTSTKILNLSNRLPQSANELAEGLYDVASSGFAGADGMQVLEASAVAASAGLSTTATSGQAITAVLNAYGMGAKEATNISDTLFQTVNLGVVTFDELAQNLGDVVGLAAQAGVSIDDVGSAIATMTLAGIPAAESTTALNRVLQSIIAPSDALIEKFHEWGFESGEVALRQLGLKGIMDKVRESTNGNVTAVQGLFPEIRALKGVLALTAADGENYNRVQRQMADGHKGAGATAKALAQQQKSLSFQLSLLKNQITNTAISFGTALLPALKVVVGAATRVVSVFSDMPGPLRVGVTVLAALSAAMLLVAGSSLMLLSRIGRMRAELANLGPTGTRAAAAMGLLGRGVALASGAALAAYGFSALDGSIEGTITGVLSLVSAVGLLRSGLPALQSTLAKIGGTLSQSSIPAIQSAGVALGGVGAAVGRLGKVAPTLALSGAVMVSTMDEMGKASVGGAINMASMAATGAQLGFVMGGPVGAAIGGTAGLIAGPLMSALGVGGESVDEYRAKFEKLADTIDSLGPKMALQAFFKNMGRDDQWKLIQGDIRAVANEIESLAKTTPAGARKIVGALKESSLGAQFTAKDFAYLNWVINKQIEASARADARREKSKEKNEAIKQAHREVANAVMQMSEAEEQAAEDSAKALQEIADAATKNLPTAVGLFGEIQKAASNFGVAMDPAVLLRGFQDKLREQLDFGVNISTIMNAGFVEIGNVVAQQGPEAGASIAKALAEGIKSGDTTVVSQLEETAKLLGVAAPVLEEQFKSTWGPAIQRGQAAAFENASPFVRQLFGIEIPGAIAESAPFGAEGAAQAAAAAAYGYTGGIVGIPAEARRSSVAAAFGFMDGGPSNAAAGASVGGQASAGFGTGVAPLPGLAGAAASDAAGSFGAGAPAVAATAQGAGDAATGAFGSGLAPLPGLTGPALVMAMQGILNAVPALAVTASGAGAAVGQSFSSGIASGIAAGSGAVRKAAAQVVSEAEAAAKAKAETGSPSKLFAREVGAPIAQGVAQGIAAELPAVARATAALVQVPALPAARAMVAPIVAAATMPSRRAAVFGGTSVFGSGGAARGTAGAGVVNVTSVIEGNVYGDDAFRSKVNDSMSAANRKLATSIRRNRG
jgi:TP901 family phage tail tape measure protein